MLDFLGLVPMRKRLKTAQQIPVSRELANVAQGGTRSSNLFVEEQELGTKADTWKAVNHLDSATYANIIIGRGAHLRLACGLSPCPFCKSTP